jgi:hypothetical protein
MYNLSNHYENLYQYLHTIITDPTVIYLHPFGSTQPENIEGLRDDTDPPDMRTPPERRGPVFIFYDQEPLNFAYNKLLFDHITSTSRGPFILINTEKNSTEKDRICDHYGFAHLDYFFHIFAAADWYRGHEYLPKIVSPQDRTLKKTYITFNRLTSNERIYRSLFVNELYKADLLDSGYVSFSKDCPDGGSFDTNLVQGIENQNIDPVLVDQAITNINKIGDLRIDFKDRDHIPNQSMILNPLTELMESFVFVVTETCYWQHKTHLTEKIFKPIVLRMPFILLGCANNLEYLRSYGFRTFGDFWDESYDQELDPIKRMQMVTEILSKLNQLSAIEQKQMLLDMQPILEHNYKLFNDPTFVRREWDYLLDSLEDICKYYKYKPPYSLDPKTGQAIPIEPK